MQRKLTLCALGILRLVASFFWLLVQERFISLPHLLLFTMTVALPDGDKTGLFPSNIPTQSQSTTSIPSGTATQTNATEKDEIWSSILKGVASSKMVPTKNVLVLGNSIHILFSIPYLHCLGDSSCGKSTLIHYLKHDPGPLAPKPTTDDVAAASSFGVNPPSYAHVSVDNLDEDVTNTLALGYTFADVHDEDNEGKCLYSSSCVHAV